MTDRWSRTVEMRTSDQICANTPSLVAVLIVISRREVELVQLREQRLAEQKDAIGAYRIWVERVCSGALCWCRRCDRKERRVTRNGESCFAQIGILSRQVLVHSRIRFW